MKVFNRVRRFLIEQKKVKNYFLYALGEIILIVFGILIALQFSNRNLEEQDHASEIKILKELNRELELTLLDLEVYFEHHTEGEKSCQLIDKWIKEKNIYNDSMNVHFGRLSNTSILIAHSTSFENLKSTGINIITNDSIRILIGKIYNFDLVSTKELENRIDLNNWYNRIEPYYNKHFKQWRYAYNQSAIPINYNEIISDPEFTELVFQTIQAKTVMIHNYKGTMDSIAKLIDLIKLELKETK